jgi:hypothetical protein
MSISSLSLFDISILKMKASMIIFFKFFYDFCTRGTLGHLQKFLQCIIVKFLFISLPFPQTTVDRVPFPAPLMLGLAMQCALSDGVSVVMRQAEALLLYVG